MGRRKAFYSNIVRLVVSIMLIVSCTSAPPNVAPSVSSTKPNQVPLLLEPAGPKRPDRFGIQSHSTYPPPECALPGALTLISNEIDYRYYITGRYASGWSPPEVDGVPVYARFSQGEAILEKDANGIWLRDVSFTSVDASGHSQSLSGATSDPIAASLSHDFSFTVPAVYFADSTQYGSLLFFGGTMQLSYSASAHTLTVTVGGSGTMITPTLTIYSGTSEFHGSAQFNVSLPTEPFDLKVVYGTVDLPPYPKNAEYDVVADYCNKNWLLEAKGQSDTPDASGNTACSWVQTGNGDKSGITWDGSCDGGDGRKVKPGTYPLSLSVVGDPQYSIGTTVDVRGTSGLPTPTPTPTPTPLPTPTVTPSPTPTPCLPGDPSCPLQCPAGQVCPPPQCLPGVNCPNPTPTPCNDPLNCPQPTPTPPGSTPTPPNPTVTPPGPTPSPSPPVPTPTPSSSSGCKSEGQQGRLIGLANSTPEADIFTFSDKTDCSDKKNKDNKGFSIQGANDPPPIPDSQTKVEYFAPPGGSRTKNFSFMPINDSDKTVDVSYGLINKATGKPVYTLISKTLAPHFNDLPNVKIEVFHANWNGKFPDGRILEDKVYQTAADWHREDGVKRVIQDTELSIGCSGYYNTASKILSPNNRHHVMIRHSAHTPLSELPLVVNLINQFLAKQITKKMVEDAFFNQQVEKATSLFPLGMTEPDIANQVLSVANLRSEMDKCYTTLKPDGTPGEGYGYKIEGDRDVRSADSISEPGPNVSTISIRTFLSQTNPSVLNGLDGGANQVQTGYPFKGFLKAVPYYIGLIGPKGSK